MVKWIAGAFVALLAVSNAMAEADCRLTLAASLPMDPSNHHRIIIPAEMDGKPLHLMIDTGAVHTFLTKSAAARLGVEPHLIASGERPNLPYAGGRATEDVHLKNFKLGDMNAEHVQFFVTPTELREADGIMGADFLHQFDVEFDFASEKMNLFAPHPCDGKVVYWTHDAPVAVIPFENERDDRHIRFDLELDGKVIHAILDTGAPNTSIGIDGASLWFHLDENTPGVEALGNGSYRYRFKTLALSGITVQNPVIMFRREVQARHINYEALLGINLLSQFHVLIAYKEHKLYVTSATAH